MQPEMVFPDALITPETLGQRGPSIGSTMLAVGGRQVSVPMALASIKPVFDDMLTAALVSLKRAMDESSVFAAVTGPKRSGKSSLVTELLASSKIEGRVCAEIRAPHSVAAESAAALYGAIQKAIGQSRTAVPVLIVVDNAHTSSDALLVLLNRFAIARSSVSGPQVVLVAEPDLWVRLTDPRYRDLLQRIALRCSLKSEGRPPPLWEGD